jgi:ubiquinone/menaquinone biosynthesis C-methylase UbiE
VDVSDDSGGRLAPGVPADYYERIADVEDHHWWHMGMRSMTESLLAEPLAGHGLVLLDAGCGTGGFLRWIAASGAFDRLVGTDLSEHAIELAKQRSRDLELHVAPLHELPFADGTFDVLTLNDVLQHVPEDRVTESLRECARVLRPSGMLLVRTNGARRARRERSDWRVYDRHALSTELQAAGLELERVTYAALVPSVWSAARGRSPRAPQPGADGRDGIPHRSSLLIDRLGRGVLAAERRWLAGGKRSVPFGHTLFALARA